MPKEDKIMFDVTEDHLKLVRRLHFQVGFCEDPCAHALEAWPAVNRKRPLGNDGAVYDVCEELGWLSPDGCVPEDRKTPALLMLAQLSVCLECFARNLEIRTGTFEQDRYGTWFHYKSVAMAIFWREAIEECSRLDLDAEKACEFAANTPARNGNPYALLSEMEAFFVPWPEGVRILEVFRDEAVRRYEAFHGNPGHDRAAVLSMLKSGTAGMEPTWAGWPF